RGPHVDTLPVLHLSAQDQPGEAVADLLLHEALERARPVQRIERSEERRVGKEGRPPGVKEQVKERHISEARGRHHAARAGVSSYTWLLLFLQSCFFFFFKQKTAYEIET